MSAICLVNLKKHNLEFDQLNLLANELIQFALNNKLAVFFNSYDYGSELICDGKMNDFFLMSDSFLYKNCEFLNTCGLDFDKSNETAKSSFMKKFGFFNIIIHKIFQFNVNCVEIYISEDGSANSVADFETIKTSENNFLAVLYDEIIKRAKEYAYGFPSLKIEIMN